jgi:mersacidin/lichenicidin family type 2 lantibiotic
METQKIIRAWKDPAYRASLSAQERARLPENPSGSALEELEETELEGVRGGCPNGPSVAIPCIRTFNVGVCRSNPRLAIEDLDP